MRLLSPRTTIRAELVRRASTQHAARADPHPRPTPDQRARIRRLDDAATRSLAGIVAEHGWPGHRLAGPDGAHAALQIATHAPWPYPALWLPKITNALDHGDLDPVDLADLTATIATHHASTASASTAPPHTVSKPTLPARTDSRRQVTIGGQP